MSAGTTGPRRRPKYFPRPNFLQPNDLRPDFSAGQRFLWKLATVSDLLSTGMSAGVARLSRSPVEMPLPVGWCEQRDLPR
jgi:hypothetical protein